MIAFGEIQTPSCRVALLVIDMQRAWVGSEALTVDRSHVTDEIVGILETARSAGIPVVFVVDISMRWRFGERRLRLVDPLEAREGEAIVEKRSQNAFLNTSLGDDLRAAGVTSILITGYASHECVAATVDGALDEGFDVIVVENGHSGGERGMQASRQNSIWRTRGIPVVPSAEIDSASLCAGVNP
jgi:nicotinamidase-related amidase